MIVDAWKYEVTVSSSRVNTCSLLTSFLNGVLEEAASPLLGPGVRGSRDGHYTTKYNLFLIHLWLKLKRPQPRPRAAPVGTTGSCATRRAAPAASRPAETGRLIRPEPIIFITDRIVPAEEESDSEYLVARWRRLVKKSRRIRRLQRYWGYLGQHLQGIDSSLRDRLRRLWPTGRP